MNDGNVSVKVGLQCAMGALSRCDGSAILSQQRTRTSVAAGIYGPVEVKPSKELPDRLLVEVNFSSSSGQAASGCLGVQERARETLVRQVLSASVLTSLNPRCGLHLGLQVLEDPGGSVQGLGVEAAAVNAACLAALDSGLPMRNLFAGVTCCVVVSKGDNLKGGKKLWDVVVEPEYEEVIKYKEGSVTAVLTLVFENRNFEVMAVHIESGSLRSDEQLLECVRLGREASRMIFDFYREVAGKKFSKELHQVDEEAKTR